MEEDLEWEYVNAEEPVRQGDIICAQYIEVPLESDLYVVITADCDIKNRKYGRAIACLPIVAHRDYVRTHWAEKKLLEIRKKIVEDAKAQIDKPASENSSRRNVSEKVIADWLLRDAVEQILDELGVSGSDRKKRGKQLELLKQALEAIEPASSDIFEDCVKTRAILGEKTAKDARSELLKQVESHCKSLPDDMFFMPGVPGQSESAALVLLREIYGVAPETILTGFSEAKERISLMKKGEMDLQDVYCRIGRLRPVFKYALSQKFGFLYSKIGFPSTFEGRKAMALEKIKDY